MDLHRDDFAQFIYDPDSRVLSILWTEATEGMSTEDFKAGLERLADYAEAHRSPRVLVDVSNFRFRPPPEIGPWRETQIVPRYNEAGVERFAYVHGAGATLPPATPSPDSEIFETRHFDSRADAIAWMGQ